MEDDIPSDTDTFGSDISVASSTIDDESDLEVDRKMQPDYDSSGDDEDFDIPVIAKPVTSKEREAIDIDVRKWCPTVYNQHSEGSRDVDVGAGIQAWGTLARSKHSEEVSPFTTLESSLQALYVHSSDEADGNDETYASWDEEYSQSNDGNAYSDVKDSTDEICRSVAENGGIDSLLICIDDSGEQGNNIFAKACCSLLSELAGSDFNKSAIVEKGGLNRLITLCSRLSDDPSILQEVMTIICTLCLRSPGNATLAMEAGAGDLAIQAMQKFPEAYQLQKNSCLMVRNLVARNAENRSLLLSNGIERIIRNAKENHKSCRDAAIAALRDLGLDNYNS